MTSVQLKDSDGYPHIINLNDVTISMRGSEGRIYVYAVLNGGKEIKLYDGQNRADADKFFDKFFKVPPDKKVLLGHDGAEPDYKIWLKMFIKWCKRSCRI